MIGAIAGDIIGSIYERVNRKTKDFPLFSPRSKFTDDTVMTVAVADCLLNGKDWVQTLQAYGRQYFRVGYGSTFRKWIELPDPQPYNSWGNGSAMRVGAVGFLYNQLEDVLLKAKESAEITHNHPEGIKGAQATAAAIFWARNGNSKAVIKQKIMESFGYDLNRTLDEIRPIYQFDVSCQGSVPEAIISFLESVDFEDAIRNAISLGGDSDTIACIAGSIAEAFYGEVPVPIIAEVRQRLDNDLLQIIDQFYKQIAR